MRKPGRQCNLLVAPLHLNAARHARRVEDEIRKLCKELLAGKDDDQQIQKLVELRAALRLHIERLRTRAADYPIIPERRQHAAIPRAESTGD